MAITVRCGLNKVFVVSRKRSIAGQFLLYVVCAGGLLLPWSDSHAELREWNVPVLSKTPIEAEISAYDPASRQVDLRRRDGIRLTATLDSFAKEDWERVLSDSKEAVKLKPTATPAGECSCEYMSSLREVARLHLKSDEALTSLVSPDSEFKTALGRVSKSVRSLLGAGSEIPTMFAKSSQRIIDKREVIEAIMEIAPLERRLDCLIGQLVDEKNEKRQALEIQKLKTDAEVRQYRDDVAMEPYRRYEDAMSIWADAVDRSRRLIGVTVYPAQLVPEGGTPFGLPAPHLVPRYKKAILQSGAQLAIARMNSSQLKAPTESTKKLEEAYWSLQGAKTRMRSCMDLRDLLAEELAFLGGQHRVLARWYFATNDELGITAALVTTGWWDAGSALDFVRQGLKHPSDAVRQAAIVGLLQSRLTIKEIEEFLQHEDPMVRRAMVLNLPSRPLDPIKYEIPMIATAINDPDRSVREAAFVTLVSYKSQIAPSSEKDNQLTRMAAVIQEPEIALDLIAFIDAFEYGSNTARVTAFTFWEAKKAVLAPLFKHPDSKVRVAAKEACSHEYKTAAALELVKANLVAFFQLNGFISSHRYYPTIGDDETFVIRVHEPTLKRGAGAVKFLSEFEFQETKDERLKDLFYINGGNGEWISAEIVDGDEKHIQLMLDQYVGGKKKPVLYAKFRFPARDGTAEWIMSPWDACPKFIE